MSNAPDAEAYQAAFDRDAFHLEFQPQVSISDGEIIGSEALLRWSSDTYGFVPPPTIISLAKSCENMVELGNWILREALEKNQEIHGSGSGISHSVAVNVSPVQFLGRAEAFCRDVRNLLETTGHSPNKLELEVTEEALIQNLEETRRVFTELVDHGLSLAMDDFGTGFSSLNYLTRIPFDTLKIDREFIVGMESDARKKNLVQAIVAMGRSLEMTVLAEGVDTIRQLEQLRSRGGELYQGYLYSKPLVPERYRRMLQRPT